MLRVICVAAFVLWTSCCGQRETQEQHGKGPVGAGSSGEKQKVVLDEDPIAPAGIPGGAKPPSAGELLEEVRKIEATVGWPRMSADRRELRLHCLGAVRGSSLRILGTEKKVDVQVMSRWTRNLEWLEYCKSPGVPCEERLLESPQECGKITEDDRTFRCEMMMGEKESRALVSAIVDAGAWKIEPDETPTGLRSHGVRNLLFRRSGGGEFVEGAVWMDEYASSTAFEVASLLERQTGCSNSERLNGGLQVEDSNEPLHFGGVPGGVIRESSQPFVFSAKTVLKRGVDVEYSQLKGTKVMFPKGREGLQPCADSECDCEVSFCIDENGAVVPDFLVSHRARSCIGRELTTAMKKWRFEPHLEEGVATAACTSLGLMRWDSRQGE